MTKWEYHIVEHYGGLFLDKLAALGQQGWQVFQIDTVTRPDMNTIPEPGIFALDERGYKLYLKRAIPVSNHAEPQWTDAQRQAAEDFHDR